MASAERKRLLRQQANAAKGKATRKYTKTNKIWQEKAKAAAAKKVKTPKTDSQLQLRVAQLEEEVANAKQETLDAKRDCMVARAELQLQKQFTTVPSAFQEENHQLMQELKKQKVITNMWRARCEAMKIEFQQRLSNAS